MKNTHSDNASQPTFEARIVDGKIVPNWELTDEQNSRYGKDYSKENLFAKLGEYAKKIGCETVRKILCMYYALPRVPAKYKAVIIGALGYLISPLDIVPDFLPGGFTDDISVIGVAVALLVTSGQITEEDERKADEMLREWFGAGC